MPAVLSLSALSMSQSFSGKDQFPQFRHLSGLSGGLSGVDRLGKPSHLGAMAISTPIGYALSDFHFSFAFDAMSKDRTIRFPRRRREVDTDSTLVGTVGFKTPYGNLAVGGMVLSGVGDSVLNVQWQLPIKNEKVGVSIGAQDLFSTGGSAGESNKNDEDTSRSFFIAATTEVQPGLHVSLGTGTRRFEGVFGNASYNIAPRLKGIVEYDAFGWNVAASYSLGAIPGLGIPERPATPALSMGLIKGKKAFWALSIAF